MDESEDNMSSEDGKNHNGMHFKTKPRKRSLVERELETNLTPRVTYPVVSDGVSTSRYGRARKLKTDADFYDTEKVVIKGMKSPKFEKSPMKIQSPVYKMHASNSPLRMGSPKKVILLESSIENQIEKICNENISLSRFGSEENKQLSPAKKFTKVYVRKDLIQDKEKEETVTLIKKIFSPVKSASKTNTHLNNILERSSEKYSLNGNLLNKSQNGYANMSSVVKTLDFDSKKKKKDKDKMVLSKNELYDIEAKCEYQVGDLAWARVGTYPFWPCIVTRDPETGTFLKKKLFGRFERDVIHVTFFGDNGRRGWIVDNMLRKYTGLHEFESLRERFTPEAKKKDPRFYAAFFISEKKQHLWNTSVEEAELLLREPKRLRIDIFNDLLEKSRASKITPKRERSRKVTRTNSDVSLSESLYDTLFSEDDGKSDDLDRAKNRSRNKSLDVSEVVTACLDNMAAKTGIIKIQRQSHMDRWLQKAKSKTPEKSQPKSQIVFHKVDKEVKLNKTKKKRPLPKDNPSQTPYSLRKSLNESQNSSEIKLTPHQNEHDYSIQSSRVESSDVLKESDKVFEDTKETTEFCITEEPACGIGIISKVESLYSKPEENRSNIEKNDVIMAILNDDYFITEQEVAREEIIVNDVDIVNKNNIKKNTTNKTKVTEMDIDMSKLEDNSLTETDDYEHLNFITNSYKLEEQLNKIYTVFNIPRSNKNVKKSKIVKGNINVCKNKKRNENDCGKKVNKTFTANAEPIVANEKNILESGDSLEEQSIIDNNLTEISQTVKTEIIPGIDIKSSKSINVDVIVEQNGNNIPINERNSKCSYNGKEEILKKSVEDYFTVKDVVEDDFGKEVISDVINENTEEPETKSKVEEIVEIDHVNNDIQPYMASGVCTDKIIDDDISKAEYSEECIKFKENYKIDINASKDEIIKDSNCAVISITNEDIIKVSSQSNDQHTQPKEIDPAEACKRIDEGDKDKVIENGNIECREELKINESSNNTNITQTKEPDAYCKDESNEILLDIVLPVVNVSVNVTDPNDNLSLDNRPLEVETIKENVFNGDTEKSPEKTDDFETASVKSKDLCLIKEKYETKKEEKHTNKVPEETLNNSDFIKYLQYRQDELMDEHPELEHHDIVAYLYKTWLYEDNLKSGSKKTDDIKASNLIKGLNTEQSQKRPKKKVKDKTNNITKVNTLDQYFSKQISKKADKKQEAKYFEKIDHINVTENTNIDKIFLSETDLDNSEDVIQYTKETPADEQDSFASKLKDTKEDNEISNQLQNETIKNVEKSAGLEKNEKSEENFKIISVKAKNENKVLENKIDEKQGDYSKTDDNDQENNRTVSSVENNLSEYSLELVKQNSVFASKESSPERRIKNEIDSETASINSEDSSISTSKRKMRVKNSDKLITKTNMSKALEDSEFLKYLELRQDALTEEHPELTRDDIISYLYSTWVYEEGLKSETMKTDEIDNSNLVKGLNQEPISQARKVKRKPKVEKAITSYFNVETVPKDKPNRNTVKPYYNEDFSDIEEEIEFFEIFMKEKKEKANQENTSKTSQVEPIKSEVPAKGQEISESDGINEAKLYFADLTKPKPNIFKGLIREKVCEICEKTFNLVKCNGCRGMFHLDCVKKELEVVEVPIPIRGRKKKKKPRGRKPKNLDDSNGMDSESQSDDKSQDANVSEEQNISIDDEFESHLVIEAESFEAQLSAKMKEMLESAEKVEYESPSEELNWSDTEVGKCEIVDVKLRTKDKDTIDNSDFKCNNCQKYDVPVCFVCKSAISPKNQSEHRQRCQIAHCPKYYHIECLDHWPQTRFNFWEPSKTYESLTCPRHVCHTCVCDDPRGCKTRFSGDKLARCVRCPATYHSFTKCLPAGTQILTASHIICPRHYEHRPGKVPCHVNTGWCFICALGGTLICCEYCPTSFHAECLNIKPPEGGYMCEDCETGRLPLYGEMVWVKLGHYRWWPGIILHPSEIPPNIMAVKHSPGEFVVRFFGQYDYYWVNRGRVFPFQEGDSGRISSQKSKIDAAFTTAMEHAQKAFEIMKNVHLNQEESQDIAMSLLPPHYVKLKVNKPCGSLCGRKIDIEESSLTQCECNPDEEEPCGPYSQCLNRMLLTECGPGCKSGDRCNNRAFEKRLYPKLTPYRTPHRGWGLKTLEDIKQGQFVIEYVGELIDEAEFQRRMRRKHETRDENFYFLTLDKERMIDAGPKGNLARFMNHCCEPNCETQKWTVLGDVRVGLFALHDIPANSEVTFNYNLECAGIDKKRCLCGAKRCSGYIGAKPKQDESQSKKGKMPAKRTYKKRKNLEESPSTSKNKMIKPKTVKPIKPKELTEIEKDLIIIKNATNGLSSDSECSDRLSSVESDKANHRPMKRKRVSFSADEISMCNDETKMQTPKKARLNESGEMCD